MAQIENMEKKLQRQQTKVIQHKEYITDYKINHRPLIALSILLPSLFIGWRMGKGKWLGTIAQQVTQIALLTVSTHFQKQLINMFNK